jgi:hypothetical protein
MFLIERSFCRTIPRFRICFERSLTKTSYMERNGWMNARIKRWGPAAFVMMVIFIASSIPGSELPEFGGWDFWAHKAAAYLHALNNEKDMKPARLFLAFCMTFLYAISDEWHQRFTPGRTSSPWDVLIDAGGGFIGLSLWCLIRTLISGPSKAVDPSG